MVTFNVINIGWNQQRDKNNTPKQPAWFLSDPGVPGVRSMGPDLSNSVHPRLFADFTDVTLADEDSNSTPADYVKRAILGNVAMQVAPPGGQNWN